MDRVTDSAKQYTSVSVCLSLRNSNNHQYLLHHCQYGNWTTGWTTNTCYITVSTATGPQVGQSKFRILSEARFIFASKMFRSEWLLERDVVIGDRLQPSGTCRHSTEGTGRSPRKNRLALVPTHYESQHTSRQRSTSLMVGTNKSPSQAHHSR